MKRPHVRVSHKSTLIDQFRNRVVKTSITFSRSGYARGGPVGIGDISAPYLSGKGLPWSQAHKSRSEASLAFGEAEKGSDARRRTRGHGSLGHTALPLGDNTNLRFQVLDAHAEGILQMLRE